MIKNREIMAEMGDDKNTDAESMRMIETKRVTGPWIPEMHVAFVSEIHHPMLSACPRVGSDYQVIATEQITAI